MSGSSLRSAVLIAVILAGSILDPLAGQEGTLVGTVLDELSRTPLARATVSVVGAGGRADTDAEGHFRLSDLPVGAVRMRVEAPGYTVIVQDVQIAPDEVAFALFEMPSMAALLEELRVVRRPPVEAAVAGNAITEVRAEMGEGALSVVDLLARQVPGITVLPDAGGAGGRILIRGTRSFSASNEPVIYLNGVRIGTSGGGGLSGYRTLEQISASEVSRIRVLRGASAGSIHSDAANGLILIETKGPTRP